MKTPSKIASTRATAPGTARGKQRSESKPPRSRLDVDVRRAQLLALGMEAFTSRSFDTVSIDELAKAAGVSKGLLYHYFPTKRVFYVETVRASAALLLEKTETDPSLPPLDRASAGIEAYLAHAEGQAGAYVALMRGGIGTDEDVLRILEDARTEFASRVLSSLAIERPSPLLRVAVRGWIGFVEAACLEWLTTKELARDELRGLLLGLLLDVLAKG